MMNSFKDQNGRKWLSTKTVAKVLHVPQPTLHNWKANGRVHKGVHWIQDSLPPKYVYWNIEMLYDWIRANYPGQYAIGPRPREQHVSKEKKDSPSQILYANIQLTPEASELITYVKQNYKVETVETINGSVISRKTRDASTSIICNMLLVKGAEAYLEEHTA